MFYINVYIFASLCEFIYVYVLKFVCLYMLCACHVCVHVCRCVTRSHDH